MSARLRALFRALDPKLPEEAIVLVGLIASVPLAILTLLPPLERKKRHEARTALCKQLLRSGFTDGWVTPAADRVFVSWAIGDLRRRGIIVEGRGFVVDRDGCDVEVDGWRLTEGGRAEAERLASSTSGRRS
jgi:hypothetical protein